MRSVASNARINVLVVSADRRTLGSVRTYLTRAGLGTAAACSVHHARPAMARCNALLLFADDFDIEDVMDLLSRLSGLPCVVVSSAVDSTFAEARAASSSRVVIVRKPALGWTLLDALRSTFEGRYSNRIE
jgi:hypothetical protein